MNDRESSPLNHKGELRTQINAKNAAQKQVSAILDAASRHIQARRTSTQQA